MATDIAVVAVALGWPQIVVTALASGVGTLAVAAIGYRYALARFKRERTFDKQLEWYERATRQLIDTANRLNWTLAADLVPVAAPDRLKAWQEAHASLAALRGLESESTMYASPESYAALTDAVNDESTLAEALLGKRAPANPSASRLYTICYKLLRHAAARLADDVRDHLELPAVERPWGIYDQEIRDLQKELAEWKDKGLDLSGGAWARLPTEPSVSQPATVDRAT